MNEPQARFTGLPGAPSKYCEYLINPFENGTPDAADLEALESHIDGCAFCRSFYAGYFAEDDNGGDA